MPLRRVLLFAVVPSPLKVFLKTFFEGGVVSVISTSVFWFFIIYQPIIGDLLKHHLEPGRLCSSSDEKGSMGLSSMALRGLQGSWTGEYWHGRDAESERVG